MIIAYDSSRILDAIDKGSAEGGASGRFWTIVGVLVPICSALTVSQGSRLDHHFAVDRKLMYCSRRDIRLHTASAICRLPCLDH